MTQTTEVTMEAGRELDALIAEKVMGWEYHDEDGTWREDGHLRYLDEELPTFSTVMADAWTVVEHLRPTLAVNVGAGKRIDTDAPLYSAEVVRYATGEEPSQTIAYETADTAPLAICRAALAAVEVPHV